MRLLSDDRLFRRALGIAILFGLTGFGARHWRDSTTSEGNHDFAAKLLSVSWTIAIVALLFVAASLILTPRDVRQDNKSADWYE